MVETEVELQGVYDFAYAGGSFDVHLRSGGRFFAPEYQQPATWNYDPPIKKVSIDWLKYGKYELTLAEGGEAAKEFHGALVGKPESWRKMKLKRPFTVAEQMLMDSEWDFIHEGGSFRVNFKADGYNHFVCHDFPAHSHWRCAAAPHGLIAHCAAAARSHIPAPFAQARPRRDTDPNALHRLGQVRQVRAGDRRGRPKHERRRQGQHEQLAQ